MDDGKIWVDITFRSGAASTYYLDETTLATLLDDWRRSLTGDEQGDRLRRYDAQDYDRVSVRLLLDIAAVESVTVSDTQPGVMRH
jgi:hypothetical protein